MYKNFSDMAQQEISGQDQYSILEIVNDEQKKQLINSHKILLVEIFADWCGPCKTIAPSYSLLALKYSKPGICSVVKQQFDRVEQAIKEKVQGIPIFLFYILGNLVDTVVGGDLEQVESHLMSDPKGQNRYNPPPQYKNTLGSVYARIDYNFCHQPSFI
jgi:thiol-disulfide isomerase/thioredoxin